jgi:NADPH2:quinone reductase
MDVKIFGTCGSNDKVKLLTEKGVYHPINYRTSDFETEVKRITDGKGVDIILDSVGGEYFKKDLNILRCGGRVVG